MDLIPPMSGNAPSHSHHSTASEPHPPASHQRRHIRYASPESSTPPPPPHTMFDTLRHQPAVTRRAQAALRASPPPPPGPARVSPSHFPDVLNITDPAHESETLGQDHDRMETDEGSDESASDSGAETPQSNREPVPEVATDYPPLRSVDRGDAMETAPDDSPPEPPSSDHSNLPSNPPRDGPSRLEDPAASMSAEASLPLQPFQIVDTSENTMNSEQIQVAIQHAAMEHAAAGEELAEVRRRQQRQANRGQDQNDGDGEDDSDDSGDEEEHPYWANFKEDTSSPDEAELAVIQDRMEEISALDHEHWEKTIFEPLSDPDYVPGESARISWTLKGVHGTPENPNKERIMRSPSICIGGLYWNIKFFPRGNDGTEQLSLYLECSPTPHEDIESEESVAVNADSTAGADVQTHDQIPSENSTDEGRNDSIASATPHQEAARDRSQEPVPPSRTLQQNNEESEAPWRAAAQVGCVMYNPDEPRVYASQKSCHSYYNDNPDWGWSRFDGPWDELHKRKRYQRQALLRGDSLAFTAYIRIIHDDTNLLWWHPPKEKPQWNSLEMTGMRAFDCQEYGSCAMVAAMSMWMHLGPITTQIEQVPIPNEILEPESRMRPALQNLQDILKQSRDHSSLANDIRLAPFAVIMGFYGVRVNSKVDVIMLWENMRRILNFEAVGAKIDSVEEANGRTTVDLFENVLLLKQPEPLDGIHLPGQIADSEPNSVQEALDSSPHKYRVWESFPGQYQSPRPNPVVLQLELHRQEYNKETRKWKKLTHRIGLDEEVQYHGHQYTLHGIVVHTGDLESREYYSVLRPGGLKSKWFKFAGDNSPKGVTVLTSNQAIKDHEGGDNVPVGKAAVAYIVSYVRSDQFTVPTSIRNDGQATVTGKFCHEVTDTAEDISLSEMETDYVSVYFYGPETFKDYQGRGIFDPWSRELVNKPDAVSVMKLLRSTTVRQIKNLLQSQVDEEGDGNQVNIWVLNTTAPAVRAYPGFLHFKDRADDRLDALDIMGGCRLWLEIPNFDGTSRLMRRLRELPVIELSQMLENASPADITTDSKTPQSENLGHDKRENEDSVMVDTQDVVADTDHSPLSNTSQGNPDSNAPNPEQIDDQISANAQAVDATRGQNDILNNRDVATERPCPEILYFVKIFDADSQILRGVGSYMAPCGSKITQRVRTSLCVKTDEAWDFYLEHSLTLKSKDLIKPNTTFLDYCYGSSAFDGTVIVAQRRPSAAQSHALESGGKCANAIDYFVYLRCRFDPAYARTHRTCSYFARGYESVDLSYGRPHGHGTTISLAGDHYTGNFIAGTKAGAGTMAYANGDTYEGDWKGDEPNGQGKMIYAKTGNMYTGGFKKRKRHGQGTFILKVADEDMQLCKICYESEMNACFNSCGHVVACDECARQVDVCPVCRATVRSVVRMWGVKVVEDLGGG